MEATAARDLANSLMATHGLAGWVFEFDRAVRRFGACHYSARIIGLSRPLTEANSETAVRNTLLHEIAHALAGQRAGHGPAWQRIARSIGSDGKRCYGAEVAQPPAKFIGRCPNCAHEFRKMRRSATACKACCKKHNGGRYAERFLIAWRRA